MATNFDRNKYKEMFESRYGSGSYESGLSTAREIGRTQAQSKIAEKAYNARLKAAENAAKEEKKRSIFSDEPIINDEAEKTLESILANPKKDGAYRNAEKIKNDPSLQSAIKSRGWTVKDFIDSMYNEASGGQYKSERDFNSFNTQLKKDTKARNKAADKKQQSINGLTVQENYDFEQEMKKNSSAQNKKEDKGKSFLGKTFDKFNKTEVGAAAKAAGNFFNPFDSVSANDAVKNYLNRDRSNVAEEVSRGANRFVNSASLGLMSNLDKRLNDRDPYYNSSRKIGEGGVTDFATSGLGYLVPGVGAARALRGTALGANMGVTGAAKFGQLAKEGAATGALMSGAEIGIREGLNPQDYNWKQNLGQLALETGAGAIGDPAIYGLGRLGSKGIEKGLQKLIPGDLPKFSGKVSDSLVDRISPFARSANDLKTPSAYKRDFTPNSYNMPSGQNVIMNADDITKNLSRTQSRMESIRPKVESYKQELDEAVNQQYQYLKNSMGKGVDTGTTSNGLQGNFREVTGRYTVSNNPQWYRDFYAQYGRKPNNTELRTLAREHVLNGFDDELGSLPAWRPESVQKIDDQIDELVTILKEEPDQAQAVRPILEALEQEKSGIMKTIDSGLDEFNTLENRYNQLSQAKPAQPQHLPMNDSVNVPLRNLPTRGNEPTPQPLRAGRDFEPIESALNGGREPELQRVSDVLLDEQRQAQGNMDSAMSKLSFDAPKKKKNNLLNLRTQFIDDLAPLENVEKQITGMISSAENSLYKQGRLSRGGAEKAHKLVQEQIEPILRNLRKNNIAKEKASLYSLMVHAKDVNSKGINSGFTNAEIDDVLRRLGTPEMEVIRKQMMKVNNDTLKILEDSSVISRESVEAMQKKWPNYMSLFREFDDEKIDFASGIGKALSVSDDPIQRLKGLSESQMDELKTVDPFESMIKNIFQATNVADRNKVATQLGRLADLDAEGKFIRKLSSNEATDRLNVITSLENGKQVKYEVTPDVYKAMKDLDKESTATIIKILQKPAGWLRAGATLTPEFSLRNPMRDVPQAFIVSESGFNPAVDFPIGLWDTIWKGRTVKIGNKEFKPSSGELYKEFIKKNGGYGNIISMDRELHKTTLKKALKETNANYIDVLDPQTYKTLIRDLANPMNTLRKIADTSETATKLGEFRAAKRTGASPAEAAYRARDIMDYSRAGVSIRQANKVVAFMNANMQGKSKLWRAFQNNPGKVIGKSFAAVTLPTIGALAAQEMLSNDKQRQVLDDAPQWLRDTFYLIPVPGTDQIARIPKPFDVAYPFSNFFERAFRFVEKNDKDAYDNFFKQSLSAAAIPVMITGLAPILEGMANYSGFRQGPIIPQREETIDYPDQYDVNTSEVAKGVASRIHKVTEGEGKFKNFGSPRIIDNTIQGLFGGLGSYAVSGIDSAISYFSDDEERPERPAKNVDQKPLAKAFLVNQSSGGKPLDDLYKQKEKLTRERGSAKQNNKPFLKEGQYKMLTKSSEQIGKINKQIRLIQNSADYTAEEKRDKINELTKMRNDLARNTMKNK